MELNEEVINAAWKEAEKQIAMDYLNQKSKQNRLTDEEIQKILKEADYQKTWHGKLSKLSKNFVQSLNPKYIKEQRAKRREEREAYKVEIKENYGMSDAEAQKVVKQFEYQNSLRGKAAEKLWNFGQEIKMRYFPRKPQPRLTNEEIEAMLTAVKPDQSDLTENTQSDREM